MKASELQLNKAQEEALFLHDNINQVRKLLVSGTMNNAREMLLADIQEMEEKLRTLLYRTHPYKINKSEQSQGKGKPKRVRWETYLGKGKPLMRAKTRDELEEKLFAHYGLLQKIDPTLPHPHSLAAVYPLWVESRRKRSLLPEGSYGKLSEATWTRDVATWNECLEGDPFTLKAIDSLTREEALNWLLNKASNMKMDAKKVGRFKTVVNGIDTYAFEHDIISHKVFSSIHIGNSYLAKKAERQKEDMIYLPAEIPLYQQAALTLYKRQGSKNEGYLAALLALFFGPRVGELVCLKWADIYPDTQKICLRRHEIEVKKQRMEGDKVVLYRSGFKTVTGLKKGRPERWIPLPEEAQVILSFIRKEHIRKGIFSEWVFVNLAGTDHIHVQSVEKAIRNINKRLGNTNKKGLHCVRRTYATRLIESNLFQKREIQGALGHEDFSTTLRYYDFSGRGIGEMSDDISKALSICLPDELYEENTQKCNSGKKSQFRGNLLSLEKARKTL